MTHQRRDQTLAPTVALLTLALSGLIGCHSQRRSAPVPCVGERVAVRVHNATSGTIDVYLHIGQARNGSILGTAPVGGAELRLPPNDKRLSVSFEARRSDGSTIAPAFGNRAEYSRITYDTICRE